MHDRLALELSRCFKETSIPEWMIKGETTLILKDPHPPKGTDLSIYRPLTCQPMVWKTPTAQIQKEISYTLVRCLWRCPWCNDHRRRKWTRRHEFKSWTRIIAFHIALIPLGKVWFQLFSLQQWVNSRTDRVLQPWWSD